MEKHSLMFALTTTYDVQPAIVIDVGKDRVFRRFNAADLN